MTTTSHYDVIPIAQGIAQQSNQVSDRMAVFIADELIPLMAGFWHKSANQLNSNLRGNALAYGAMLKGFTANEIRDSISALADEDPDREFAPLPQELKKICLSRREPAVEKKIFIASMSSLEMQVCTKCLTGQIAKTQQAVDAELSAMIEAVYANRGEISGNRGFAPLKSIITG